MGRGGVAPSPSAWVACSRRTEKWRGERMKFRVRVGSVGVFIPQGTIGGLFWTMGWAVNSNEAEIF